MTKKWKLNKLLRKKKYSWPISRQLSRSNLEKYKKQGIGLYRCSMFTKRTWRRWLRVTQKTLIKSLKRLKKQDRCWSKLNVFRRPNKLLKWRWSWWSKMKSSGCSRLINFSRRQTLVWKKEIGLKRKESLRKFRRFWQIKNKV